MYHSYRKIATAAVLSGALLIASACGNNSGEAPANIVDSTEKTTSVEENVKLRIYWWGAQNRHDATQKAMDMYTKLHPNVTFEPEFSGWDGYWDKLASMTAAGNMPDIVQMDSYYLADYADKNQLADLGSLNMADVEPALLDTGKYKDKLYAIPLGNNALGFVYNKKLMVESGIELPQNGWTWEDVKRIGQEAKAKLGEDVYFTQDFTWQYMNYEAYQLSRGKGHPITTDGIFNFDQQTFLDYMNMYENFRKEGLAPPPDVSLAHKDFDPKFDLMANGTALSRFIYAVQIPSLESLAPDTYELVSHPKEEQNGAWLKPSMFWSASAKSKHLEEAKAFIDWFVNDVQANEVLMAGGRGAPSSTKVVEALDAHFTPIDKKANDLINLVAQDPAPFNPGAPGWASFRDKDFKDIGEQIMFGELTPEKAWDLLVSKAKSYQ